MTKSNEYKKFEEEIARLKSKLARQQDHHMEAMRARELESQELWNDLQDECEELKVANKKLQDGIDWFKKSQCTRCGGTGWRLVDGPAAGEPPKFPLREELKALKHTINETRDCGHHRDVARWQQNLTKLHEKNTALAEDNKELQLEVLSLLGQLQDRGELSRHRDLWRNIAKAADAFMKRYIDPKLLKDPVGDDIRAAVEELRKFGEENPHVDNDEHS